MSLTYSGNFRLFNAGDATALSGTYYNAGYRTFGTPDFSIKVHDTTGDSIVYSRIRVSKTGGNFKADEQLTNSDNDGNQPTGYTFNWSTGPLLINMNSDLYPSYYADIKVPDVGDTGTGSVTASMLIELLDTSGNTVDSISVTINVAAELTLVNSSTPPPAVSMGTTVFHLYENGSLPAGGRPAAQEPPITTNTNLSGQVVNNDDEPHTMTLWATDENGDRYAALQFTVEPDSTFDLTGVGTQLPEGQLAFWESDGHVTGSGVSAQVGGTDQALDLTFPPQEKQKTIIVTDNGTLETHTISIGDPQAPQQHLNVPGGQSRFEYTYSGDIDVQGGTVSYESTGNDGTQTILVSVPTDLEPAVEIASASTGGGGSTSTTTVVRMPSGNTIAVDNQLDNPTPPPPSAPPAVTAPSVGEAVPTSSSSLVDEAARQLVEIRAELLAVAAGIADEETTDELVAQKDALLSTAGDAVEDLQELADIGQDEDFLIFGEKPASLSIGSTSEWNFNMLGQTYTMNFDNPVVSFMRNLLLVAMSVAWFIGLVRFTKV